LALQDKHIRTLTININIFALAAKQAGKARQTLALIPVSMV